MMSRRMTAFSHATAGRYRAENGLLFGRHVSASATLAIPRQGCGLNTNERLPALIAGQAAKVLRHVLIVCTAACRLDRFL